MIGSRRDLRVMNGVCAFFAVSFITVIGAFLWSQSRRDSTPPLSPRITNRREMGHRGREAERRGDFAEAERDYLAAVALPPKSAGARFDLAQFYVARNRRKEAWEQFRTFIPASLARGLTPVGGPDGLAWYGDLCREFGTTHEAKEAYTAACAMQGEVSFRPDTFDRLCCLAHCQGGGMMLRPLGPGNAIRHYQRAVEADPSNAYPLCRLALELYAAGKKEEAGQSMKRAAMLTGKENRAMFAKATRILELRQAQGSDAWRGDPPGSLDSKPTPHWRRSPT